MEPPHSHSCLMTSRLCHSASEPIHLCLYCIHLFLGGLYSSQRVILTAAHISTPQHMVKALLSCQELEDGCSHLGQILVSVFFFFYVSHEVIWDTTKGFWWRRHGLQLDRWCGVSRKIKILHNQLSPFLALWLSQLDSLSLAALRKEPQEDLELSILCKLGTIRLLFWQWYNPSSCRVLLQIMQ